MLVHQQRVADLVVGHREMAVPEQGQLLEQRPVCLDHTVQPPGLDVLEVLQVEQAALEPDEQRVEVFVDALGMQELLEGGLPAELLVALDNVGPRREPGAPQQQGDAR